VEEWIVVEVLASAVAGLDTTETFRGVDVDLTKVELPL
jgi:hypothetical protein